MTAYFCEKHSLEDLNLLKELPEYKIIVPFTDHPVGAFGDIRHDIVSSRDDVIFYMCKQPGILTQKNIRVIDYFLLKEYLYTQQYSHNTIWNPENTQALIIFGKIYREHRFTILRNLILSGTLNTDNYRWSLDLYEAQQPVYKKNLGLIEISDLDLSQVEQLCMRLESEDDQQWGFTGYPYNADVYQNALYNVILETYIHAPRCLISEKTWKSISNHLPFISVVSEWQIAELQSQGFHTFTEYYLMPGEQYCPDTVSKNFSEYSERFRNNILNNITEISEKVTHNYENFVRIAKLEQQQHQELFDAEIYYRHHHNTLTRADYPNFFFHSEVYDFGRHINTTVPQSE